MRISAVIFDLDGTLLDTLPAIAKSANNVLVAHNLPTHPERNYLQFIGRGTEYIILGAAGVAEIDFQTPRARSLIADYIDEYASTFLTVGSPYNGVEEMLLALQARHIPMSIASNKSDLFVASCTAHFLSGCSFVCTLGASSDRPKKPAPDMLLEAASRMQIEIADCLMVGDSDIDRSAADAAGAQFCRVSWGYGMLGHSKDSAQYKLIRFANEIVELVERGSKC